MNDASFALFGSAVIVVLWLIYWRLGDIKTELQRENIKLEKIKDLQLNPRTRIGGPIAVQSGPVTQEQQLKKLGRASAARRVVVGGDPDSQLNHDLNNAVEEDDNA